MTRSPDLSFMAGGGEMGERSRNLDWASTPVGTPDQWPESLKTAVSICLGSRYPIVVWWGNPAYTMFYNDGYIPVLGVKKHPGWLGGSGRECWSDIWHVVGPMLDGVFASGEATWSENLLLVMDRNRPREECYFTFSYSPIRGDDGTVPGIFCACYETTGQVIGERRLRTLRDLSRMAAETKAVEGACEIAARTLGENPADIPFALIYLLDDDGRQARLVAMAGLEPGSAAAPTMIDLNQASTAPSSWPLRRAHDSAAAELVENISGTFGPLPGGPWPESPDDALIVPIAAPGQAGSTGFLVCGLSPRRVVDADYRSFLYLVAGQIGTTIANARAYEEERKRAEALAEIDRAKTAFFSNVSHEFRTPLTLMMGPLEDALAGSATLSTADRERLELAHRNSLRLLKLVNTLLDFSRIEAGRVEASYEPVDLSKLTAELASVFRSAVERAGMSLAIDCPPLAQPVYVDREMWEKIVLNLISNAFKFTFEGSIEVSLRRAGPVVELEVRDTGTGIPQEEIPRLFERFHRVKGARGRSYEGSGIGLALVQELVKLHGGWVRVESELDRGSRFLVSVPLGKAHLPANRIEAARALASTGLGSEAYVEEALRWLPDAPRDAQPGDIVADKAFDTIQSSSLHGSTPAPLPGGRRILLVDDNADMREYVRRLLQQSGYDVETAADGLAALRAARLTKPDLVLTDVMMPGLDGFGLLRELRADPQLATTPIILLSARAGEEARIEGMQAGADDYVSKPFSAREILARVESHLRMGQFRHDATEALRIRTAQFETLLNQAPLGVYLVDADLRIREVNPVALPVFGDIPGGVIGRDFDEIIHILWEKDFADEIVRLFRHTLETGEPYASAERSEPRADTGVTEYYEWRLDRIRLADGRFGVVCYFRDISKQVQAEKTRQLLIAELNHRVKNTLATVQAIVQQTLRSTRDAKDFATHFAGRLQSLARVHALLTDSTWQGAGLRELIRDQLLQGPIDDSRLTAWGPAVVLGPDMTLHMALMLHELGTNCVKYGALSVPGGWVTVSWSIKDDRLHLQWVERGGPRVNAPTSRGFGTTLIEQSAKSEGGQAQMLYEAEGITWDIVMPLQPMVLRTTEVEIITRPPAHESESKATSPAALAGQRILVVEDEPLIAMNLADTLEIAGAQVAEPVGTVKEALRVIEQNDFDMVLLDANLHGRPIDEIAAALTRRNIPFVFVTGYGRQGVPASFQHIPVVPKPFTERQLIDAVTGLVVAGGSVVRLKS